MEQLETLFQTLWPIFFFLFFSFPSSSSLGPNISCMDVIVFSASSFHLTLSWNQFCPIIFFKYFKTYSISFTHLISGLPATYRYQFPRLVEVVEKVTVFKQRSLSSCLRRRRGGKAVHSICSTYYGQFTGS